MSAPRHRIAARRPAPSCKASEWVSGSAWEWAAAAAATITTTAAGTETTREIRRTDMSSVITSQRVRAKRGPMTGSARNDDGYREAASAAFQSGNAVV